MAYTPKTEIIKGVAVKVLDNWKIVQVRGGTVAAVSYDGDDERQWVTSELKGGKGEIVRTVSGSVYRLPKDKMHNSLWQVGLQAKRPESYASLQRVGVI